MSLFFSIAGWACDSVLREFSRDCAIQDQLNSIRARLLKQNINLDDVAEYRALRFIDRKSWEEAKVKGLAVELIYPPAPLTWQIWDGGIRRVFNDNGALNRNILDKEVTINEAIISALNHKLLSDGINSVKDKKSNAQLYPGQYRTPDMLGVGFCTEVGPDYQSVVNDAIGSAARFQQRWEAMVGFSLASALVKSTGGSIEKFQRSFLPDLTIVNSSCNRGNGFKRDVFINYIESPQVMDRMQALSLFIKINLELFQRHKPVLAPIEFAAFVQKWLIFIHPFSDGNGRTSRAVQDLILTNFNLPFAPAGDLQDDVLTSFEKYLERTYNKMESMLAVLSDCATLIERNQYQNKDLPQCRVLAH
ncbi:MAG: Fic family protein [Bdellovibrionaceae bacterium]|nr:Fic family protein [Bdellovibrio sp.]